ncbi:MAG: hypothetical protein VKK63_11440 [Synechococcus sp.]|nr:hypothetical protein [Synechococcus sp.]
MAIFSVEIADRDVERVIESLCLNYRRPEKIKDEQGNEIDNPESKPMFANRMVREFLSDHVRKHELDLAKQALENSINPPSINDPYI